MESSLINFINSIQLEMKDSRYRSDHILRTLCSYAEGKISRKYCVLLVFTLLQPFPSLRQRFSEIVESLPPSPSRGGCLIDEIFLNTVIEFEIWPGVMEKFLKKVRSAIICDITLVDVFCELEYFQPTSGPFWLLWDIFEPISQTNHFMQLLFDGCVNVSLIPQHLNYELAPSESDADPSHVVPVSIIDSDLVCTYKQDIRTSDRPVGERKNGSYGLLSRDHVDCKCSGRGVRDFLVLNDRWSTAASGLEVIFCYAKKNQYEERLFSNEDERIDIDVRVSRMRSTLKHVHALYKAIFDETSREAREIVINQNNFPRFNLTELDMLTITEIYGPDNLDELLSSIADDPLVILPILIERIEDKISSLTEYRRNKESEYFDLNKRNTRRSLDVNHEFNNSIIIDEPLVRLRGGRSTSICFIKSRLEIVDDVLTRTIKLLIPKNWSDIIQFALSFIRIAIQIKEPPPIIHQLVFHSIASVSTQDKNEPKSLFLTPDMYQLLVIYSMICEALDYALTPKAQSSTDNNSSIMGLQVAVKLGHLTASSDVNNSSNDLILEQLPQSVSTGRYTPSLESLFDSNQYCQLNSLESLKKAIQFFIRLSSSLFTDEKVGLLIEAIRIDKYDIYRAYCLENLNHDLYIVSQFSENEDKINMIFHPEVPRIFKEKRTAIIKNTESLGPVMITHDVLDEEQNIILSNIIRNKGKQISTENRSTKNDLIFRLSDKGVEFKNTGEDFIRPRDTCNPSTEEPQAP